MNFKFLHNNINVLDLEKSLAFYEKALGLKEVRRKDVAGAFTLVYLGDKGQTSHELELTYLHDRKEKYDLGENETHIAFMVDDFAAAHALHEDMGCICYENKEMGIYFIADPDGYWLEVIPKDHQSQA
jgi:lactoylglutathione lyase